MGSHRELPPWALPVAIVVSVAVLVVIGWRVLGGNGEVGPSKEVHPGMYDIRQEIQKARAAQGSQGGVQTK
ncbi:MAG TPA: hypothetical protein VKU00_02450 [Chthonomonadaceae bacterium]|nr:hypothetical protein [Chthonomonadaceae bacterium]